MSKLAVRLVARWEAFLVLLIVGAGIWSTTLSSFFLQRANLLGRHLVESRTTQGDVTDPR